MRVIKNSNCRQHQHARMILFLYSELTADDKLLVEGIEVFQLKIRQSTERTRRICAIRFARIVVASSQLTIT